ncbi:MAG: FoF1 ATP synthase subunit gamma [Candidatus Omnitrophota bacterium]|nr:FoF1 ATP synthase subunit gamma [Candidatus Omnitrophota bacterium]
MFQLTKLRKEIDFNKEIGGIINVLRGVASSEFYRLQKARKKLDEFIDYLQEFFQMLDIRDCRHLFLENSPLRPAIVLVTSDIGFLGKLNVSIVNSALEQCSGNEELIVVGRQGAKYIAEAGREFSLFSGIDNEVEYKQAEDLADFIVRGFLDKKFGRTIIVYPQFVSFAVWKVQIYQVLPCRFLFRFIGENSAGGEEKVIVEPELNKVITYLVKIWMSYVLYGIFWESKLSEWSARVMHLEGSSDEIKQIDKKLRFQYFRILHEISDKNVREVLSSRLAVERMKKTVKPLN